MQNDPDDSQGIFTVRIETSAGFADIVQAALDLSDRNAVRWDEEDCDAATFEMYTDTEEEAFVLQQNLSDLLNSIAEGEDWRIVINSLAPRDWQEYWKEFFHAERVSDRIVIAPPWEHVDEKTGTIVIEIEPGMSFGTGQHATTRACLQYMDELAAQFVGHPFLDIGCGSGVLAIAAARLGYDPVSAVDHDPLSISIAQENCTKNGCPQISVALCDLNKSGPETCGELVVANILAEILKPAAPVIAAALSPTPNARLVLAGILTSQFGEIEAAYRHEGIRLLDMKMDGEWSAGLFSWSHPT